MCEDFSRVNLKQPFSALDGKDSCCPSIRSILAVILHAARAALLAEGVTVTSHRGVRRLFGQHLIKSGKLPPNLAEILADEQDDRILADYDVLFDPEVDRVQKRVNDADNFLETIKAFLKRQMGL